jgi:hypothetical protein
MNRYFYIDAEGKQKGTYTPMELREEGVKRDTLVWAQGMEQWQRAEEVDELSFLFSDTYYPPQPEPPHPTWPQSSQSYAPGQEPRVQPSMPKTWLVESILVTILPFFLCGSFLSLLGIIGIVYAAQVESFYNRGDYQASVESSRSAGKWTRAALWIAIAWVVLIIIVFIALFALFGFSLSEMNDLIDI